MQPAIRIATQQAACLPLLAGAASAWSAGLVSKSFLRTYSCSSELEQSAMNQCSSMPCSTSGCRAMQPACHAAPAHSKSLAQQFQQWRGIRIGSALMADADSLDSLQQRIDALEDRLARQESSEGVRDVMYRLLMWMDSIKQQPEVVTTEAVKQFFTPTAVVDAKAFGVAEEHEGIVDFMKRLATAVQFSRHHVTNATVDVSKDDPSSAKARMYLLAAATVSGRAVWSMETIKASLQRDFDGKWRLRKIEWEGGNVTTDYAGPGWVQQPDALGKK